MKYKKRWEIAGYTFLIPGLFFVGTFLIFPTIKSLIMSFTDWNGFNTDSYSFVGLKYYQLLFDNKKYWDAIVVNLKYAFWTTIIQTIGGFVLAFIVYYLSTRWQNFYKVALYLPVILPASVIAIMWRFMLNNDIGLINTILRGIGLGSLAHAWVGERGTALGTVIAVNAWQYVGFTMVLYYIAFKNISTDILEAAEVDGANKFQRLIHFFIPLTVGMSETNVILTISGCMKAFSIFFLLTGGGPGRVTTVAAMVIYDSAFVDFKFSYALAMSVILFLIILVLIILSRVVGRKYNYLSEE